MKPITQRETLQSIRKPLPPAKRVILDRKTKARRKRVKKVEAHVSQCDSEMEIHQWDEI